MRMNGSPVPFTVVTTLLVGRRVRYGLSDQKVSLRPLNATTCRSSTGSGPSKSKVRETTSKSTTVFASMRPISRCRQSSIDGPTVLMPHPVESGEDGSAVLSCEERRIVIREPRS